MPATLPGPDPAANYSAMISAWLESHKHYPESARQRGEEGGVKLRFRVDRYGRVLGYRLLESTGYADLDAGIDIGASRVGDGDAGEHVLAENALAQNSADFGKLDSCVYSQSLCWVGYRERFNPLAVTVEDRDYVGQVELTLIIVRPDFF